MDVDFIKKLVCDKINIAKSIKIWRAGANASAFGMCVSLWQNKRTRGEIYPIMHINFYLYLKIKNNLTVVL